MQQKKFRDKEKKYIAEGKKITLEALKYHSNLVELVVCTTEALDADLELFSNKVKTASKDEIKRISSLKNPQEIFALIRQQKIDDVISLKNKEGLILALESIRDPGNLGTIIRLADWFGVESIVCSPDCVDCYNPKVVQASMGAVLRTQIYYQSLQELIDNARENKYEVYGTSLNGDNIYSDNFNNRAIIIMGNESEGLSEKIIQKLSGQILIPNFSAKQEKTESLNVSMATSIVLSEFVRRKYYSK